MLKSPVNPEFTLAVNSGLVLSLCSSYPYRTGGGKIVLWEEVPADAVDGANQGGSVADRNLAAETAQLLLYRPKRQAVKVTYVKTRNVLTALKALERIKRQLE